MVSWSRPTRQAEAVAAAQAVAIVEQEEADEAEAGELEPADESESTSNESTSEEEADRNAKAQKWELQKSIYGLYCMYALVGLVNGFISNFINIPICQYVFGPMGEVGRSTLQQCNVAGSIYQMPWKFKLFYGLFLDRVPFLGSRRKGWIMFGWSMALLVLLVLAGTSDRLVTSGDFSTYCMLLMCVCAFYMFSDVSGDGMAIEMVKLEPEETRGHILVTGQLVRFMMMTLSKVIGILGMDGSTYQPNTARDAITFPFELSFQGVHIVLFCLALPFWAAMAVLLRDPPRETLQEKERKRDLLRVWWKTMKTKAMLFLIVQNIGSIAIASLMNPASNVIASIANPSTLQVSTGGMIGSILFMIGIWLFRTYLMNRNWRFTFLWTNLLSLLNASLNIIVIYNAWGVGQDGWFYALSGSMLQIVAGIAQIVPSLAIAELAPSGLEASVYEFLSTMHHAAIIALRGNFQNLLVPAFSLNDINYHTYFPSASNPFPPQSEYNAHMSAATYTTTAINLGGTLVFMWFLPRDKEETRRWAAAESWHKGRVGALGLAIGAAAFVFSMLVSFLSMFPSTMCLQLAGGPGCG